MKKVIYLSAIAAVALAGCTNDDTIVSNENELNASDGISFRMNTKAPTRAEQVGVDAATKLNNHFVVYGTKHSATEDKTATNDALVFPQYQLEYTVNSANTTESNSSGWEYVGKKAYDNSSSPETNQSIKYWDYGASAGYTFTAFSSNNITYPKAGENLVSVEKITTGTNDEYDKGYTVTVKSGASLDNLFFSDRTPIAKTQYDQPVTLTFRGMGAKVRVGFYETIPGYKVKIDKFYFDTDASAAITSFTNMVDASTTNFKAALQNVNSSATENTFTVTYYNAGTVENRPKITNSTTDYLYNLELGGEIIAAENIGTASNAPTWDKTDGAYTTVFPMEANTNPMLIKLDYTLISEDTPERIEVKNARAIVPAQYVQWKSNTSYTYIFKISDNTNGTTGVVGTDKEGLYPITFAAVAVTDDNDIQETITTVATNSVTTYQMGEVVNEYTSGKDIYVVNSKMTDNSVIAPTAIGAADGNAQIYLVGQGTGADAISEATVFAKLTGSPNGLTLTAVDPAATLVQNVPAADGTNYNFGEKGAVKFTPSAAGTYAYVYCTTPYAAPTYTPASEDYNPTTTYYFRYGTDPNYVYYAASGISAKNYAGLKSQLYTISGGTPGVYDIKVIKVVAAP